MTETQNERGGASGDPAMFVEALGPSPVAVLYLKAALQEVRAATVLSGSEVKLGKVNVQLKANVQNQDRAQRGQNEAGRMIAVV
jgi:hypothetical protein